MNFTKQKQEDRTKKKVCKYGNDCYQKNPSHHDKYEHPKKRESQDPDNPDVKQKKLNDGSKVKEQPTVSVKTSTDGNCVVSELDGNSRTSESGASINSKIHEGKMIGHQTSSPLNISELDIAEDYKKEIDVSNLTGDMKDVVKKVFLIDFPNDFYSLFEFCSSLSKISPENALKEIGLFLVGPYSILSGKVKKCSQAEAMLHYRYYFDPPEFYTVLKGDDSSGLHFGYFFDDPNEAPCFVASNEAVNGCEIKCVAANIFGAINVYLNAFIKGVNPFTKMKIQSLQKSLEKWCKGHNISLDTLSPEIKKRRSAVVAKTFHGAGIVVPYNKKTQLGYRELAENDKSLKQILKNIVETTTNNVRSSSWSKLQPVITFANIANDECDFGTSLELGIDLFCYSHDIFHKSALQLLKTAYSLLGRQLFGVVAEVHLANRRTGFELRSI